MLFVKFSPNIYQCFKIEKLKIVCSGIMTDDLTHGSISQIFDFDYRSSSFVSD